MLKSQATKCAVWKPASRVQIVIAAILLVGCSTFAGQGAATVDPVYLTPIPQETLQAYQWDTPVRNKMDAVIVARLTLETTRLDFTETPKVISVEEMNRGDTKVWRVIFEGDWQISGPPTDPAHPETMEPPSHGCVYVIIDANGGSHGEIGTTKCST